MTSQTEQMPPSKDYRCRRCGKVFPVFFDGQGSSICPVCGKPKHVCCLRCEGQDVEEAAAGERYVLGQPGAEGLTDADYFEAALKP